VCGQGQLYAVPRVVERRLDGNAWLSAIHCALEQLRCSVCEAVWSPYLPNVYSAKAL